MPESLNLRAHRLDIVFNRCFFQVPPAGFHVEQQVFPFAARHPVNPDIGEVDVPEDDLESSVREHIVNVQPFFHISQIVRIRQLVLFTEVA